MSFPKAVLFLCDYQAPYGGSFIPALKALEAALGARGTRVVWALPEGAGQRAWCRSLQEEGRAVELLPTGCRNALTALDRLVRRGRIDLIHAHFGLFAPARAEALLHPRLRVVLHVHSDFSGGQEQPALKRLFKNALNRLGSGRVRRVMVGAHMAGRERGAVYVPNGVDFSRAAADTETREAVRGRLGLKDAEKLVLLFGWSPYIKGLDVAARAVERLKDEGFVLGVVTGREMTAEKLADWLKARGCTAESVRFLPPVEEVFAYHRAADVLLSASRSETFSYALAEALYTGRPCVMSDIPGTAWAAGYETVRSFPAGDDAACAAALKAAAEGYPSETCARVRAGIERDCAVDRWAEGMLGVYESMG